MKPKSRMLGCLKFVVSKLFDYVLKTREILNFRKAFPSFLKSNLIFKDGLAGPQAFGRNRPGLRREWPVQTLWRDRPQARTGHR